MKCEFITNARQAIFDKTSGIKCDKNADYIILDEGDDWKLLVCKEHKKYFDSGMYSVKKL